jgi:2',3'-cyclic-nucleotide 2'-phosphodiesterase (5'-nucleotidase family)
VGGRNPADNQPLVSAVPQVQEQIDILTRMGVKIIMILDHAQDYTDDPLTATELSGVDIIIAAGSTGFMGQTSNFGAFNKLRTRSSQANEEVGLEDSYPTARVDKDGNPLLVINSDQLYFYIGTLMVKFDDDGKIVTWDGRSGPIATTIEAVDLLPENPPLPLAEVRSVLTSLQNTPSIQDSFQLIGTTTSRLVGARFFIRTRESNLGRIVADSTIWEGQRFAIGNGLPNVDIALKNGGGIRDDIFGPNIIRLTVQAALAFNNRLSIVELTATQLLAAMENAISRYPAADGRFPHVAGMTLVFDASRAGISNQETLDTPSRLQSLVVTKATGEIDVIVDNFNFVANPSATYVMATNSFLLTGGDGYAAFAAGNALGETDIGEQQILEDYIIDFLGGTVDAVDPPPNPRVAPIA